MSQFSHDAPVVKPAERTFTPPLPQEMPVAEKASRLSPELQTEKDALQEQMAEARFALQTANEEMTELDKTIKQLEGKTGLSEEEQADLAESQQQYESYKQDLADSAKRLSDLFERNREIDAFIESASQETSGEAIVEQVRQTKEAEARAKETPTERVGREYQEVTTEFHGAKQTIAEKETEKKRLEEELKNAQYAAGRVDFEERPITEEVHNKHEAAAARVEQITQQIQAADAVIAQQKDALVDAERKSIALFSEPAIEGPDAKQSVREVVAAEAGKNAKEKVAEHFQNPEEGIAWMRNTYLPARMKETILPSRRDLEAEFQQREEVAKRAGASLSRLDFVEEVRKRTESDQTVQGLMDAAKKRTADADSGNFLNQQRQYLEFVLSGFANPTTQSRSASDGRWEAGEEQRETLLKLGQKELIKESQRKASWVEWMNKGAQLGEAKRAQREVHAYADAAEKITEQEALLKKQRIDRPAFEEKIAAIQAEQKHMDQIRELQRTIHTFENAQVKGFDRMVAEKIGALTERLRTLQEERRAMKNQDVMAREVRDAQSAVSLEEMKEKMIRDQLNAEETKKKNFLDYATDWYSAPGIEIPLHFSRRQIINGEPKAVLETHLNTQKAALQKLIAEEPRKLFNKENYDRWMESKTTLEKKIASVEGTKDQPGLLQKFTMDAAQIQARSELDPSTMKQLEASLRVAHDQVLAARTEATKKQSQFEQQASRRAELDKEIANATTEETQARQQAMTEVHVAQTQEKRTFLANQDQTLLAETNKRTDIGNHEFERRMVETITKDAQQVIDQVDGRGKLLEVGKKGPSESLPKSVEAQTLYADSEILRRAQAETDASREKASKFADYAREALKRTDMNREFLQNVLSKAWPQKG